MNAAHAAPRMARAARETDLRGGRCGNTRAGAGRRGTEPVPIGCCPLLARPPSHHSYRERANACEPTGAAEHWQLYIPPTTTSGTSATVPPEGDVVTTPRAPSRGRHTSAAFASSSLDVTRGRRRIATLQKRTDEPRRGSLLCVRQRRFLGCQTRRLFLVVLLCRETQSSVHLKRAQPTEEYSCPPACARRGRVSSLSVCICQETVWCACETRSSRAV